MGEVVGVVGGYVVEIRSCCVQDVARGCVRARLDFARPKGGKKLTGRPPMSRAALRAGSRTPATAKPHASSGTYLPGDNAGNPGQLRGAIYHLSD